ncbi:hypothetical protein GOM49_09805 [Clostridium bovifaecis]|uniref:Uncharacterized protein n=1 Tax=Clostridium bovifaecis TaxID=2184719 RepID=A0A6I6ENS1_9CLOT|nr:hypothetical protein GOM49_09805 [Clostridium bovifaecis]
MFLENIFHFSFAEYYNPVCEEFGILRVIDDNLVKPTTGFDLHTQRYEGYIPLAFDAGKEISFQVKQWKQAYLVQNEMMK